MSASALTLTLARHALPAAVITAAAVSTARVYGELQTVSWAVVLCLLFVVVAFGAEVYVLLKLRSRQYRWLIPGCWACHLPVFASAVPVFYGAQFVETVGGYRADPMAALVFMVSGANGMVVGLLFASLLFASLSMKISLSQLSRTVRPRTIAVTAAAVMPFIGASVHAWTAHSVLAWATWLPVVVAGLLLPLGARLERRSVCGDCVAAFAFACAAALLEIAADAVGVRGEIVAVIGLPTLREVSLAAGAVAPETRIVPVALGTLRVALAWFPAVLLALCHAVMAAERSVFSRRLAALAVCSAFVYAGYVPVWTLSWMRTETLGLAATAELEHSGTRDAAH